LSFAHVLVVANVLLLVAQFTHAFWLLWIEIAFYLTLLAVFVRSQILDYRRVATKFPIPPHSKA